MRILNDYHYRKGYTEGVFMALRVMTPSWFVVGVSLALWSLSLDFWTIWLTLYFLAMPAFWLVALIGTRVVDAIATDKGEQ